LNHLKYCFWLNATFGREVFSSITFGIVAVMDHWEQQNDTVGGGVFNKTGA
jgi:hypothetical protein